MLISLAYSSERQIIFIQLQKIDGSFFVCNSFWYVSMNPYRFSKYDDPNFSWNLTGFAKQKSHSYKNKQATIIKIQ